MHPSQMSILFCFFFPVSPPCSVISHTYSPISHATVGHKEKLSQHCMKRLGGVCCAVVSRPQGQDHR